MTLLQNAIFTLLYEQRECKAKTIPWIIKELDAKYRKNDWNLTYRRVKDQCFVLWQKGKIETYGRGRWRVPMRVIGQMNGPVAATAWNVRKQEKN